MTAPPMLADFSLRLALGLSIATVLIPWRTVPLPFFRTQEQIILGLLALGALDQARASGTGAAFWIIVIAAVLAYVSSIAWGLGLPVLGVWTAAGGAAAGVLWLLTASRGAESILALHSGASRVASGFLLGSVLCAMLLGHYYLTAPAMTIEPLKRTIVLAAVALAARVVLAGIGLALLLGVPDGQSASVTDSGAALLLGGRWGMGFLATGVATLMTWRTALIRSTQSATGILYIAMIFALFGELMSLVLSARYGVIC